MVAGLAIGLMLVGEAGSDKHGPYWLPDHSHTEIPEGTTRHFSLGMRADSGATTTAASTGTIGLLPHRSTIGH